MAGKQDDGGSGDSGTASVPKVKKPRPPYNLKAQLISAIRRVFFRHPLQSMIRKRLRIESVKFKKDGSPAKKPAVRYPCSQCGGHFPSAEVNLDHIEPVVPIETGFSDWNTYIDRLFCESNNIQLICKPCHKIKSGEERSLRAIARHARKRAEND